MKYFIHYNPATGDIIERRPQLVDYPTPMPKPYILAEETEFIATLNGTKRINTATFEIEDIPIVLPTLEELKGSKCAAIRAESDRRITIIQEGYSQGEIKTFEQQHKGALDILSGDETTQEAQFVIALLNGRLGREPVAEEKAVFATQICTNYSNAAAATALIVGEQQRLELEARSATTKEELQAIEWSDGN